MQKTSNLFNHSGTSRHREKRNSQCLVLMLYQSYSPLMKIEKSLSSKVYVKTTYTCCTYYFPPKYLLYVNVVATYE